VKPILDANNRWKREKYRLAALVGVAALSSFMVLLAAAWIISGLIEDRALTKADVLKSLTVAGLRAPDMASAMAAAASADPEAWKLTQEEADDFLRSSIFDPAEISVFNRTAAKVIGRGKDVDGHPNAVFDSGQIRRIALAGRGMLFQDLPQRVDCGDRLNDLVATNGEMHVVKRGNKLSVCGMSYEWPYFDGQKAETLVAAALHPLGKYLAYLSCSDPNCESGAIKIVDIQQRRLEAEWDLRKIKDNMQSVSFLTLGAGFVAIGGCARINSKTQSCATSAVKVFDWGQRLVNAWQVDSPKIRAIALSNRWAAFAYDDPGTASTSIEATGRIQVKRVHNLKFTGQSFKPPEDDRNCEAPGGTAERLVFSEGGRNLISVNSQGMFSVFRVENVPFQGAIRNDGIKSEDCYTVNGCTQFIAGNSFAVARDSGEFVLGYSMYQGEKLNVSETELNGEACIEFMSKGNTVELPGGKCSEAPPGFGTSKGWRTVSVSKDGKVVAAASFNMGRVWVKGSNNRFVLVEMGRSPGRVASVAVSSDGRKIAWGKEEGHVELWEVDPDKGTILSTGELDPPLPYDCVRPRIPGPFYYRVTGLVFTRPSKNEELLAAADGDGCVQGYVMGPGVTADRIWKRAARNAVLNISVDETGSWLAAGTVNGDILVWDLKSDNSSPTTIKADLPWTGSLVWLKSESNGSIILAANARWGPIGLWQLRRGLSTAVGSIPYHNILPQVWLAGRGTTALAGGDEQLFAFNLDGRLIELRPYSSEGDARRDMQRLACAQGAASALEADPRVWQQTLTGSALRNSTWIKRQIGERCLLRR
jgi:hypothetical protein